MNLVKVRLAQIVVHFENYSPEQLAGELCYLAEMAVNQNPMIAPVIKLVDVDQQIEELPNSLKF